MGTLQVTGTCGVKLPPRTVSPVRPVSSPPARRRRGRVSVSRRPFEEGVTGDPDESTEAEVEEYRSRVRRRTVVSHPRGPTKGTSL